MQTNEQLLNELINKRHLKASSIIKSFLKVDRADFVGGENAPYAYLNQPLPIGFGQTISQPLTVALMLEWFGAKAGDKILDIGCGSGWTVALLSSIVGAKGKVVGLDRIPELVKFAKANLSKYPALYYRSVIKCGDGSKGFIKEAPYDGIIVAAAGSSIPNAWKDQLKVGGRIVAPVKDSVVVIDKLSSDKYHQTTHWGFAFVPLIEE